MASASICSVGIPIRLQLAKKVLFFSFQTETATILSERSVVLGFSEGIQGIYAISIFRMFMCIGIEGRGEAGVHQARRLRRPRHAYARARGHRCQGPLPRRPGQSSVWSRERLALAKVSLKRAEAWDLFLRLVDSTISRM